jgi:tetratricopeptide (TPR) repeat protein
MNERLQYTMDDVTDSTVSVTLRWEKLAAVIPVSLAVNDIVIDSLASQLRGLPYFFAESWATAGRFALTHGNHLDIAGAWADSALVRQKSFGNLRLKAAVLDRKGDKAAAEKLRAEALPLANEAELNAYGYQLLGAGQVDQAIVVFQKNVKDHPESWNGYDSLAEGYARKGNKALALANYRKALAMTADQTQKARIEGAIAGLK